MHDIIPGNGTLKLLARARAQAPGTGHWCLRGHTSTFKGNAFALMICNARLHSFAASSMAFKMLQDCQFRCLRQSNVEQQTVQMMMMFGPLCAADVDAPAFATLPDSAAADFTAQSGGLQQQVFAHQLHSPHLSRVPPQPSR